MKFNDIMKNLNEKYTDRNTYFDTMYRHHLTDKQKKEIEEKEKNAAKTENEETKGEAIKDEVSDYLENIDELLNDYLEAEEEFDGDISELQSEKESTTDASRKNAINREITNINSQKTREKIKYNQKLRILNSKLSAEAKKILRNDGNFTTNITSLKETVDIDNLKLSILEEKMIFGNLLENIDDVNLLEQNLTHGLPTQGNANAKDRAAHSARVDANRAKGTPWFGVANQIANQKEKDAKNVQRVVNIADSKRMTQQQIRDVVSGESIKENENLELKHNGKDSEEINSTTQKKEPISNDEIIKPSDINESLVLTEKPLTLPENEPKNNVNFNKFSETLFNGGSGEALKYFLKGEINNKNIRSLEIAKMMEKDPEVQVVIKKLKFYLRKTAKGLSYEEYTDLKVQKGKFRSLFGKAEKEYLTRYHKK